VKPSNDRLVGRLVVPWLIAALITVFATSPLWAQETAKGKKSAASPPYKLLRYDEDYSSLRDPLKRTDLWDPLKFIPLNKTGDAFLSLGGEFRFRYEWIQNLNWGAGIEDEDGYFLQRHLLHSDLHLKNMARLFLQLETSLVYGRTGGPLGTHSLW